MNKKFTCLAFATTLLLRIALLSPHVVADEPAEAGSRHEDNAWYDVKVGDRVVLIADVRTL